jgi:hypothetical protein
MKMKVIYRVTAYVDDNPVVLGSLGFDAENTATLNLNGSTDAHKMLKKTWEEVATKHSISIVQTIRSKDDQGRLLSQTFSKEIENSHDDYPSAVVQFLGTNHGYVLSKDFAAMAAQ